MNFSTSIPSGTQAKMRQSRALLRLSALANSQIAAAAASSVNASAPKYSAEKSA